MNSKRMTTNAFFIALTIVILYLNIILPISTISILTLASFIIPLTLIRNSIKDAILVYISSSIISFFLIPLNISLMYICFFGIYGIIKYFIEKLNKLYLEILLKLLFFNFMLILGFLLLKSFFPVNIIKISIWLFIIISQIVFLFFDYALTLLISFYLQKLHKKI